MNKYQIEQYFENECNFRDYDFKPAGKWGRINQARTINLLNPKQRDLDDALDTFARDGFGTILIYLDAEKLKKPKRIKTVFSSCEQVFHLWANQSQAYARQGGRLTRAFFEGTSCYSYGRHYEVGRIVEYQGVKLALINNKGYSNTTRKHISKATMAVCGLMPYLEAPTLEVFEALVHTQGRLIDDLMKPLAKTKFWSGSDANSYDTEIEEFNTLCKRLKHPELILKVPKDLKDLLNSHIKFRLQREAELNAPEHKALLEKARTERKVREENRLALKNAEDVERWRRGEINPTNYIRSLRPQILRFSVTKGAVVTSGGAEVPLREALTLLRAIEAGKAKPGMEIGSFKFDHFDPKIGVAKIGCHNIALSEARNVLGKVSLKTSFVNK